MEYIYDRDTKVTKCGDNKWKVYLGDYRTFDFLSGGYTLGAIISVFDEIFPDKRPYAASLNFFSGVTMGEAFITVSHLKYSKNYCSGIATMIQNEKEKFTVMITYGTEYSPDKYPLIPEPPALITPDIVPPIAACTILDLSYPIFQKYNVHFSKDSTQILNFDRTNRIQYYTMYFSFKDGRDANDFKSLAFFSDACPPLLAGWFLNYLNWTPSITLTSYFFQKKTSSRSHQIAFTIRKDHCREYSD